MLRLKVVEMSFWAQDQSLGNSKSCLASIVNLIQLGKRDHQLKTYLHHISLWLGLRNCLECWLRCERAHLTVSGTLGGPGLSKKASIA